MSALDADLRAPTEAPSGPPPSDAWRAPVRWFGVLCLVAAAFLAGYVGWLLWGTGLETKAAQADLRDEIEGAIARGPGPGTPETPLPGGAYAILRIPSIDVDVVVVEGTDHEALKKGPGHYPDTADPWDETGRVGIAGHRTTYLAPFWNLDRVRPGDRIELLTARGTFVYEATRTFVIPAEGSGVVLDQTRRPTLVLTTCNPRFSAAERLIVEADLVDG
jgi:sortase A